MHSQYEPPIPSDAPCQIKSGKPDSNICLAINRMIDGEECSQFHTVICWEKLAETTGTYVKKGDLLDVQGRLEYRTFPDEEGKDRGICAIIAL